MWPQMIDYYEIWKCPLGIFSFCLIFAASFITLAHHIMARGNRVTSEVSQYSASSKWLRLLHFYSTHHYRFRLANQKLGFLLNFRTRWVSRRCWPSASSWSSSSTTRPSSRTSPGSWAFARWSSRSRSRQVLLK